MNKIFCIGHNKTATTSLHDEFLDAGFNVAGQGYGELLLDYYLQGEFKQIISF